MEYRKLEAFSTNRLFRSLAQKHPFTTGIRGLQGLPVIFHPISDAQSHTLLHDRFLSPIQNPGGGQGAKYPVTYVFPSLR